MKKLLALAFIISLTSCSGLIHIQKSEDTAISIRDEAIDLLSQGESDYTDWEFSIEILKAKCNKAYEFEKTRSWNHATKEMWKEVITSNGSLFAVLDLWKANGTLSPAFIDAILIKIERQFNSIIDLENHKK